MGTMSNARAIYGLTGTGTPTSTNVAGSMLIGVEQTQTAFATADIVYSFKVESTGASDVATLTLSSGSVAQTTGTPTITDGDGNDFEGVTLPTAVRIYAALAVADAGNSGAGISFGGSNSILGGSLKTGGTILSVNEQTSPGTASINFNASGDVVTITVVGKSS